MPDSLDVQLQKLATAVVDEAPAPPSFPTAVPATPAPPPRPPHKRSLALAAAVLAVVVGITVLAVTITEDAKRPPSDGPIAPRPRIDAPAVVIEVTNPTQSNGPGTWHNAFTTANSTDGDVEIRVDARVASAFQIGPGIAYSGGVGGDHDLTIRGAGAKVTGYPAFDSTSRGWLRVHDVNTNGIRATGSIELTGSSVDVNGGLRGLDAGGDVEVTDSRFIVDAGTAIVAGLRARVHQSSLSGASMFPARGDGIVASTATVVNSSIAVGGVAVTADRVSFTFVSLALAARGVVAEEFVSFGSVLWPSLGVSCDVGSTRSRGFNVTRDATCGLDHSTDREFFRQDLGIGAMAAAGGPTPVLWIGRTTKLYNAIPLGACADAAPSVHTDQRGFPRPRGKGCDIGAMEVQPGDS
jgi:hypothetical protein